MNNYVYFVLFTTCIASSPTHCQATALTAAKSTRSAALNQRQIQWIIGGSVVIISAATIAFMLKRQQPKKDIPKVVPPQEVLQSGLINTGNSHLDAQLAAVHNCYRAFSHINVTITGDTLMGNRRTLPLWFMSFLKRGIFDSTDLRESIASFDSLYSKDSDFFENIMNVMHSFDKNKEITLMVPQAEKDLEAYNTSMKACASKSCVSLPLDSLNTQAQTLNERMACDVGVPTDYHEDTPFHKRSPVLCGPILRIRCSQNNAKLRCPLIYKMTEHPEDTFELHSIVVQKEKDGKPYYITYTHVKEWRSWYKFDPQAQSSEAIDDAVLKKLEQTGCTDDGVPTDIFYVHKIQALVR